MVNVEISCTCPHLDVGKLSKPAALPSPPSAIFTAPTSSPSASPTGSRALKRKPAESISSVRTQALANYHRFLQKEEQSMQRAASTGIINDGRGSFNARIESAAITTAHFSR
ncbi:hypothetical protein Naga_102638g1 [Nannochloropsis gaditana]|uniref:Uncharacterized protein n=1 Tax=Nannochloropsis gaditana TaxID=72520 RepID=W7T5B0_9STRA|nr:hypothetical protein Naga_102638g1 [Nannochloropsis gaditana]